MGGPVGGLTEQMQQALIHQVLLEEDEKGEEADATHRDHKPYLPQIRLIVTEEKRPVGHERQRKESQLR